MRGISFKYNQPITPADPHRMDVVCFVGFVARRSEQIPEHIKNWLEQYAWLARAQQNNNALVDVPIPIESWETFDALFAWDQRLNKSVVLSSEEIESPIVIDADVATFIVVVNRKEQTISIPSGTYTPEALATYLDENIENITVAAETHSGKHYLLFSAAETEQTTQTAAITIFTHNKLGFPKAVSADNQHLDTYLGASVRAFFRQGGRKCYVVSMGEPELLEVSEAQRISKLSQLLTADTSLWSGAEQLAYLRTAHLPNIATTEENPDDWHGIEHVLGLSDVSYLCLPDLADLLRITLPPATEVSLPPNPEVFVDCAPSLKQSRKQQQTYGVAPRFDDVSYDVWSRIVSRITRFVRNMRREIHLVASLPLPDASIGKDFNRYLSEKWFSNNSTAAANGDFQSAFLQLSYPWLKSSLSDRLPGRVLPPEGVLVGLIAAKAISRGAFVSVAGSTAYDVYDFYPQEFTVPQQIPTGNDTALYKHISLFARVPGAVQLFSDVTTSKDESYRPAVISRITALLVRAAKNQGRSSVFEPISQATWRAVEKNFSTLLGSIYAAGGLRGRSEAQAYDVQCNLSTMTQNDIDNGRLIANVSFQPATPIERIEVALLVEQGGRVQLQGAA